MEDLMCESNSIGYRTNGKKYTKEYFTLSSIQSKIYGDKNSKKLNS